MKHGILMNKARANERIQQLETQNAELSAMLRGCRKGREAVDRTNDELHRRDIDITIALMRYENMLIFRLARWIIRKKRPTDILQENTQ